MVDNAAMSALLPSIDRAALLAACNAELRPEQFKDYGPNGLQVEGKPRISKIVSGVDQGPAGGDAADDLADARLGRHRHRLDEAAPAAPAGA